VHLLLSLGSDLPVSSGCPGPQGSWRPSNQLLNFTIAMKQSSYRAVLSALECELQSRPYRLLLSQMAAVVDPTRSAVFKEIMY